VAAIRAALQAAKGVRTEAARLLAIDYQRLKRKLTKYGLAP
jgi:DNA-binding NtrC family response regulator